nr:MAG TPA_asm: Salt tolerance down-regulator [Caudoviricetes sp.]
MPKKCKCSSCERRRKGWPGYQPCASKMPTGEILPPPKKR